MRRRATLSVAGHPNCKDQAEAEKAVNEVWDSCIKDTRPFDEVTPIDVRHYATLTSFSSDLLIT